MVTDNSMLQINYISIIKKKIMFGFLYEHVLLIKVICMNI